MTGSAAVGEFRVSRRPGALTGRPHTTENRLAPHRKELARSRRAMTVWMSNQPETALTPQNQWIVTEAGSLKSEYVCRIPAMASTTSPRVENVPISVSSSQ
jgi:hypothetical protein